MSTLLQLAGAAVITAGAFFILPAAGFLVAGVFLILIGLAVSK